jgi:hypothetical protein
MGEAVSLQLVTWVALMSRKTALAVQAIDALSMVHEMVHECHLKTVSLSVIRERRDFRWGMISEMVQFLKLAQSLHAIWQCLLDVEITERLPKRAYFLLSSGSLSPVKNVSVKPAVVESPNLLVTVVAPHLHHLYLSGKTRAQSRPWVWEVLILPTTKELEVSSAEVVVWHW